MGDTTSATAAPIRILIVDDDDDLAQFVATILQRRLDAETRVRPGAFGYAEELRDFDPDVVVLDIELSGHSGLDLLAETHAFNAALPAVMMTAHTSVDYAVRSLRERAAEFLRKPLDTAELVTVVGRLAQQYRRERAQRAHRSVLAIGAHPDDVEIGVGATLLSHVAAGDSVAILTLSRGARGGDSADRQHEAMAAAELLGARLFLEDLPDAAISNGDPTVGVIERVVNEIAPTTVYVHSRHDRHQDHRAAHEAAMIATRRIPTVACYQSPSTTIDFRPTRFVTVDDFVENKLKLIACFASQTQIRDYLDPGMVRATARYWSRFGTAHSAEPLEIVRESSGIAGTRATYQTDADADTSPRVDTETPTGTPPQSPGSGPVELHS